MPGLGSLLTSDDDMDACSAAAQAALSAARLAGYRTSTSGKPLPENGKGMQCLMELRKLSRHISCPLCPPYGSRILRRTILALKEG